MASQADVSDLVRNALAESAGWRVRALSPLNSHSRDFSTHLTFMVEHDDSALSRVFVKFVRGITNDRQRLQQLVKRDYDLSCYLAQAFADTPGISIPHPIAYSGEHLMLINQFVEGTRLQDKIIRDARLPTRKAPVDALAEDCHRCGRWLRVFQESTRRFLTDSSPMRGDDVLSIESITRLTTDRLEELHGEGVLEAGDFGSLVDFLQLQEAAVSESDLASTGVHGDFFPGNLLVRDDDVTGIDFVMFRSGSIYYDPTYFVYQLETFRSHPAYRSATIDRLRDSFLHGYAPDREPSTIWDWNPMCRVLRVMHASARLLRLIHSAPSDLGRRILVRARVQATKRNLLRWSRDPGKLWKSGG